MKLLRPSLYYKCRVCGEDLNRLYAVVEGEMVKIYVDLNERAVEFDCLWNY